MVIGGAFDFHESISETSGSYPFLSRKQWARCAGHFGINNCDVHRHGDPTSIRGTLLNVNFLTNEGPLNIDDFQSNVDQWIQAEPSTKPLEVSVSQGCLHLRGYLAIIRMQLSTATWQPYVQRTCDRNYPPQGQNGHFITLAFRNATSI